MDPAPPASHSESDDETGQAKPVQVTALVV